MNKRKKRNKKEKKHEHRKGYRTNRIAVEKNGQIVPKSAYESTVIKDGDSLEVVSFVGGG